MRARAPTLPPTIPAIAPGVAAISVYFFNSKLIVEVPAS